MKAKNEKKLMNDNLENAVDLGNTIHRSKEGESKVVVSDGKERDVDIDREKETEMKEEEDFIRWYGGLEDEESIQPKEEAVQVVRATLFFFSSHFIELQDHFILHMFFFYYNSIFSICRLIS